MLPLPNRNPFLLESKFRAGSLLGGRFRYQAGTSPPNLLPLPNGNPFLQESKFRASSLLGDRFRILTRPARHPPISFCDQPCNPFLLESKFHAGSLLGDRFKILTKPAHLPPICFRYPTVTHFFRKANFMLARCWEIGSISLSSRHVSRQFASITQP